MCKNIKSGYIMKIYDIINETLIFWVMVITWIIAVNTKDPNLDFNIKVKIKVSLKNVVPFMGWEGINIILGKLNKLWKTPPAIPPENYIGTVKKPFGEPK